MYELQPSKCFTSKTGSPNSSITDIAPPMTYQKGVLLGNWVEDGFEAPGGYNLYSCVDVKEKEKVIEVKPQTTNHEYNINKLRGNRGNAVPILLSEYGKIVKDNYTSTNELVYNRLTDCPKRKFNTAVHQYLPQRDMTKYYGNLSSWGLLNYKRYDWAIGTTSDYVNTTYDVDFTRPRISDYMKNSERKGRDGYDGNC